MSEIILSERPNIFTLNIHINAYKGDANVNKFMGTLWVLF